MVLVMAGQSVGMVNKECTVQEIIDELLEQIEDNLRLAADMEMA